MTGRGSGKLVRTSEKPLVTIGLTLSTSAPTLSLSSQEPFYIIVTARILTTPFPDKPVTLQTYPSPLESLSNRSFNNIICTTVPAKRIEIFPRGWPQYHYDSENLRSAWSFVTIPREDQGPLSVRHEIPRDKIEAADLLKGEQYKVALTDKGLGTRWWSFDSLQDLEGVRLRSWKCQVEKEAEAKAAKADPEFHEEMNQGRKEKYGDGPVAMGEDNTMLAMVPEVESVEFEIV